MNRILVVVMSAAVAGAAAGCSGGSSSPPPAPAATPAPAPAQQPVTNNTIVTQISNPDEAMKSLAALATPDAVKPHLDAGTAVTSTGKLNIVAAIGMQSANGIVAQYAGDDASAQKLAQSVKSLADRISLRSAALESLVAKSAQDFKEPDATRRSELVRADMRQIQDELKATLDRLGDGAAATMMIFGAWIEGVRISSAMLQAKYDAGASDVLNRKNEAEYFLAHFAGMPAKADPLNAQITPALRRLYGAMTADKNHQIGAASVKAIQAAATEIAGLLRK